MFLTKVKHLLKTDLEKINYCAIMADDRSNLVEELRIVPVDEMGSSNGITDPVWVYLPQEHKYALIKMTTERDFIHSSIAEHSMYRLCRDLGIPCAKKRLVDVNNIIKQMEKFIKREDVSIGAKQQARKILSQAYASLSLDVQVATLVDDFLIRGDVLIDGAQFSSKIFPTTLNNSVNRICKFITKLPIPAESKQSAIENTLTAFANHILFNVSSINGDENAENWGLVVNQEASKVYFNPEYDFNGCGICGVNRSILETFNVRLEESNAEKIHQFLLIDDGIIDIGYAHGSYPRFRPQTKWVCRHFPRVALNFYSKYRGLGDGYFYDLFSDYVEDRCGKPTNFSREDCLLWAKVYEYQRQFMLRTIKNSLKKQFFMTNEEEK